MCSIFRMQYSMVICHGSLIMKCFFSLFLLFHLCQCIFLKVVGPFPCERAAQIVAESEETVADLDKADQTQAREEANGAT